MATLYSSLYGANNTQGTSAGLFVTTTSYAYIGPTPHVTKGKAFTITGTYDTNNGLLNATNTQLYLGVIPKGFKVTKITIGSADDLDSATDLTVNLGNSVSATAYASADTGLQGVAGSSINATIIDSAFMTAEDNLIMARAAGDLNTAGILSFSYEVTCG